MTSQLAVLLFPSRNGIHWPKVPCIEFTKWLQMAANEILMTKSQQKWIYISVLGSKTTLCKLC